MKQNILVKFFFFSILIGVELLYNVVLVSAVQQSESVIHVYVYPLVRILKWVI